MAEPLSYCGEQVRRADHDRFLATLFVPAAAREKLFALYAFNAEIAKVRETVSEPMLGQIRLQWWREAIDGVYAGRVREHPVLRALAAAIAETAPVPEKSHFERLIDGREFDLAGRAPEGLAELESYCEATASALLWLAAEFLGARMAATRAALRPLGIAWALTGVIRAIPFHARAQRQLVPDGIAREAGLTPAVLFGLHDDPALSRAVERLAAAAEQKLQEAAVRRAEVEAAARPLFLYAVLARAHLRRLRRRGYRIMDGKAELSRPAKLLSLWWAARRL